MGYLAVILSSLSNMMSIGRDAVIRYFGTAEDKEKKKYQKKYDKNNDKITDGSETDLNLVFRKSVKSILFISIMLLTGCTLFVKEVTKIVVVPSDEYIVKMTYTNSFGQVVEGAFVPNSKLEEFNKYKVELDYFKKVNNITVVK